MKRNSACFLSLWAATATVIMTTAAGWGATAYTVGEKWVYAHQGPRPMRQPNDKVNGDRVQEVLSTTGKGSTQEWQIKQTWGDQDQFPATLTIDAGMRIRKITVGETFAVEFVPPLPSRWEELKIGEEKTLETKLNMGGFEVPLKLVATRLEDQTQEVPAGRFENCRHIQVITHSTDPSGNATQTRNDYWYHAKINGVVKETFTQNYQTADAFSGTSLLKSYHAGVQ